MHDTITNHEPVKLLSQPIGISPQILVTQVKNTVPFIFNGSMQSAPIYVRNMMAADNAIEAGKSAELHDDHLRYYEMCLSAHHATVASFVPTDVDNHIRHKLWLRCEDTETLLKLRDLVADSLHWDCRFVSTRFVATSAAVHDVLSGHHGEWFSTAVGAYAALKKQPTLLEDSEDFAALIVQEINRELAIYTAFRQGRDGIALLKTATIIAHNLGDLNRVADMWGLGDDDFLKKSLAQNLSAKQNARQQLVDEIQTLNRDLMAVENHRHFALRKPRSLRRRAAYLLPIGPFLDAWGGKLATSNDLSRKDLAEVVEALIDGWQRLDGPVGYARALAGISEHIPGGMSELASIVPARVYKTMQSGKLRQLISIPQERFEAQWRHVALKLIKKL